MNSLVLNAPKNIEIRDIPVPEPNAGEVLVLVRACSLDRYSFNKYMGNSHHNGSTTESFGLAGTGSVETTGTSVHGFKAGDRVAFWGDIAVFSDFCKVPVTRLFHLPDEISFEEGVNVYLFPEIFRGVEQGRTARQAVFISGAGPVGMLCAQVCHAYGADRIIISDLYDQRLKRALHVTADIGINASTEDVVRRIKEDSEEGGVDVCLECTGEGSAFSTGEKVLRSGGRLVVLGHHSAPISLNLEDWSRRSLTLIMGKEQPEETRDLVERGLQMAALGTIALRPLLTHVFPLHRAEEAFELMKDYPGRTLTVALRPR
ncbi:MAG: zinc-binding dehydrogenase [Gemmatimonadota bacterium]|nr:zinc-binding dehydrogenase [Gemmatimonadota bacterium]